MFRKKKKPQEEENASGSDNDGSEGDKEGSKSEGEDSKKSGNESGDDKANASDGEAENNEDDGDGSDEEQDGKSERAASPGDVEKGSELEGGEDEGPSLEKQDSGSSGQDDGDADEREGPDDDADAGKDDDAESGDENESSGGNSSPEEDQGSGGSEHPSEEGAAGDTETEKHEGVGNSAEGAEHPQEKASKETATADGDKEGSRPAKSKPAEGEGVKKGESAGGGGCGGGETESPEVADDPSQERKEAAAEEEEEGGEPYEEPTVALRALTARLLDPWGYKISLELVLLWPCTVETVKRKLASQVGYDLSDPPFDPEIDGDFEEFEAAEETAAREHDEAVGAEAAAERERVEALAAIKEAEVAAERAIGATEPKEKAKLKAEARKAAAKAKKELKEAEKAAEVAAKELEEAEEAKRNRKGRSGLDKLVLVLSNSGGNGKLKNDEIYPEEGLHPAPPVVELTERQRLLRGPTRQEREAEEREKLQNPPYHTAVWGVVVDELPGSPGPPDNASDRSLFGTEEDLTERTYISDVSSVVAQEQAEGGQEGGQWVGFAGKKGRRTKGGASAKQQQNAFDPDDNSLSMAKRRKNFDLARELRGVSAEDHFEALEVKLGVHEFTSFATLTVDELNTPGLGIPRPAQRRIAALAKVYQDQMDAEDAERAEAKLRARQGRLKKKKLAKMAENSDVEEGWAHPRELLNEEIALKSMRGAPEGSEHSLSLQDEDEEDEEDDAAKMGGKWTVDGKYFFVSKGELNQAWRDASLVFRANLPSSDELVAAAAAAASSSGGGGAGSAAASASQEHGDEHGDFSAVDGYSGGGGDDPAEVERYYGKWAGDKFDPYNHPVNSVVEPRPPSPQTLPDPEIMDAYMQRLLRPPTPEPPPPVQLRPHGVNSTKLMAKIRRRCARDDRYEIPRYLDAQHRMRMACCNKHGTRSAAWRWKKRGDLRRAVSNLLDDAISLAAQIGHGHVSREAIFTSATAALRFFSVQVDSAEEERELVEGIIAAANPTGDIMGFNQRVFEDAVADLVEKQFAKDNPVLGIPNQKKPSKY